MPIQFCCTQCGEPIEVDDEHAGQSAACPYCRHLVTIPPESTYQPQGAVPARPAANVPPESRQPGGADTSTDQDFGLPPPLPGPRGSAERQRTAAAFGNYALICAGIVVVLFGILLVSGMVLVSRVSATGRGPNPTVEQLTEELQELPGVAWLNAGSCGLLFFATVGLVLAIVSLYQSRTANWRGWVALAICGGSLLCVCGMFALAALALGSAGIRPG